VKTEFQTNAVLSVGSLSQLLSESLSDLRTLAKDYFSGELAEWLMTITSAEITRRAFDDEEPSLLWMPLDAWSDSELCLAATELHVLGSGGGYSELLCKFIDECFTQCFGHLKARFLNRGSK